MSFGSHASFAIHEVRGDLGEYASANGTARFADVLRGFRSAAWA